VYAMLYDILVMPVLVVEVLVLRACGCLDL